MHPKQLRLVLVILGCLAAFLWSQFGPAGATAPVEAVSPAPAVAPSAAQPAAPAASPSTTPTPRGFGARGFRNRERLEEHFDKHGHEFGAPTAAAYLALAQAVRDGPVGDDILEATRSSDGVVSRYQRSSGAFLAFDADGTIRTFFKPNDGERYFRRQLTRRPQ
jgi:pyocin large subunit-like protein